MKDELALVVDGKRLTGWTEISVTRGIEQMPNTFEITATENSPTARDAIGIQEGAPCTVSLGPDKVVTGYIDFVVPSFNAGTHEVRLAGRGKCADLVDCASEWPGMQISNSTALQIAQKLAAVFGIKVKALTAPGPIVDQFNISLGDTPADILELVTRNRGLLYYEDSDGDLVLSMLTGAEAASGFKEGDNVQSASVTRSMAQRYSEYRVSLVSVDQSAMFGTADGLFYGTAKDPFVRRHRRLVIVDGDVKGDLTMLKRRAEWEAARRAGRGLTVNLTVDTWRDAAGKLWTPNTLAAIDLPTLKLTGRELCISAVTYRQSLQGGTTAEVTLMPKEAFIPEPLNLLPVVPGVT